MSVMIDRHSLILPVEMSMFPSAELPARLSSVSAVIVIMSHQRWSYPFLFAFTRQRDLVFDALWCL
jgi:hypothetical protein